ncbi:unnamed protein product [Allacma fusca]|uniref:Dual specificity protein phosphatase 19 n=1 Tax=Allacma fusca TaxID=39272 RepID=A0A8J2LNJ1_9HEXA|nr:unnamed protein product [Allacma fusca]
MDPDSSSLLSQLQGKLKKLQPTQTKLTRADGQVSYFQNQGLEKLDTASERSTFGFVVDTKPDLTCGKVLPWLFVSSQDVPQDLRIVQELEITHILSLLPGFQLYPLVKPFIKEHLVLEFYDEENFITSADSEEAVSKAMRFIQNAKASDSKILIHCNAGLSRAPTIAMIYLIRAEKYNFEDAWEKVKSARVHAQPNAGFLKYLRSTSVQCNQ